MGACKSKKEPSDPSASPACDAEAVDLVALLGGKLMSKEGEVPMDEVLTGKTNILIYFSAHWCPPCRGFTPQLAKAYKESGKAGKETVVIFVSSDKDQSGFDEYYGEMPWHALPYAERDLKEKVSEKYGVQGIPMLIVLDGTGKLISKEGRGNYMEYLPSGPSSAPDTGAGGAGGGDDLVQLFGDKLVGKNGEVAMKEALAGKSNIMIYFSAHWCPPCRGFTPQLAEAYKGSAKAGKETEVIFVSSDKDQSGFDGYYGEMPWLALPYSDRKLKEKLSTTFGVKGIPMLIVLDQTGKLVTADGRAKYKDYL